MSFGLHADILSRHLAILPFRDRLAELTGDAADQGLWDAILAESARLAESEIDPIAATLDRVGARLAEGRVTTPPEHHAAWKAFREGGWVGMALPEPHGQGLPLTLLTACDEILNRASAAFMMLPTASRSAASLLVEHASAELREIWVPRLASGEWAATICISEPDAGSDVGRIKTRAVFERERWLITGSKCWISFGDHDLSKRIGHCMLARTGDAPGVKGLSLFLVPSSKEDGSGNGIGVARIEEKMGLHGSPTCVLNMEEAEGILIGAPGRGLNQLLSMMLMMRLSCGPQGTGVATAAFETALAYAAERRQGGPADKPPVPIVAHPDVQRQLLSMAARVEVARGLNLAAAAAMDIARLEPDRAKADDWNNLAQVLLPVVKDGGAWCAYRVATDAVQVLGGAGFTREWPVERLIRDSRVFPLFEGTSGIQALDLLHRRIWRDGGTALRAFLEIVRSDAAPVADAAPLVATLDRFDETVARVGQWQASPRDGEAGAAALLELTTLIAHGWIAARIVAHAGDDVVGRRMRAGAQFFLAELEARAAMLASLAGIGAASLDRFDDLGVPAKGH